MYNADHPISLQYAVLLNANRVYSTGKQPRLGVRSKFQIVHLPVEPALSAVS